MTVSGLLLEYVKCVLREATTWFHGRSGTITFSEGRPSFFASNRTAAEWYSYERGEGEPKLVTVTLTMNNPASFDDLEAAINYAGATESDVRAHSGYDCENVNDYLYVPGVRNELEHMGYDSYVGSDQLANDEVKIAVVWRKSQIHVVSEEILPDM